MPPPTPRKFAEKIALHTQKGVEEAAIFSKIMAECAAMTGALKHALPHQGSQSNFLSLRQDENIYLSGYSTTGMEGFNDLGVKMTTKDEDDTALYRNCNLSDTRLLSPILFPKISSKHVSLPDVGEDIQEINVRSDYYTDSSTLTKTQMKTYLQDDCGATTRRSKSGSQVHLLNLQSQSPQLQFLQAQPQTFHQGSEMSLLTTRKGAGPIRQNKSSRVDTSPYRSGRSERFTGSSAMSASESYHHLFPPDNWRRAISDSSIPSTITVSTNFITNYGETCSNQSNFNGPRISGSPSLTFEGLARSFENHTNMSGTSNQIQDSSYLELPKNNFDTTNGSLPDLTNWSLSPGPYGMESQQEDQASHHSSNTSTNSLGPSWSPSLPQSPLAGTSHRIKPIYKVNQTTGPLKSLYSARHKGRKQMLTHLPHFDRAKQSVPGQSQIPFGSENGSEIFSLPVSMLNDEVNSGIDCSSCQGATELNGDLYHNSYTSSDTDALLDEAIKLMEHQTNDPVEFPQYWPITEDNGHQGKTPNQNVEIPKSVDSEQPFLDYPIWNPLSDTFQKIPMEIGAQASPSQMELYNLNNDQIKSKRISNFPSGIPDIILTTDFYIPDLALQLTPLDPSEIRLLDEDALGITDPSTEDLIIHENYHFLDNLKTNNYSKDESNNADRF